MSAIVTPPGAVTAEPTPRLLTVEDLPVFPSDLPSGPVIYELLDGRLVTMAPPGDQHGAIQANLTAAFKSQGDFNNHGKTRCGDVGIVLRRGPDRVVGADVLFVTNRRLPLRLSTEGYLETIPELIVEVRSPNDTLAELERKSGEYLAAGAVVVWVVNPIGRQVIEYRLNTAPRLYTENDTLTVDDLIPGFSLSVRAALAE